MTRSVVSRSALPNIVDAGVAIANTIAVAAQHTLESAEILEVDVPDRDRRFVRGQELTQL